MTQDNSVLVRVQRATDSASDPWALAEASDQGVRSRVQYPGSDALVAALQCRGSVAQLVDGAEQQALDGRKNAELEWMPARGP